MSRPLRIEFPGAVYHVTSRGDRRESIYRDDADRQSQLQVIAQAMDRFDAQVLAYCLMGNHFHLVLHTRAGTLSRLMRHVNGVYTQRFNHRHGVVGHLFQGRFKAILVDRDAYLLALCRYVERNPVAAGMVDAAAAWPWSSHRAHLGLQPSPDWLDTDGLHGHLLGKPALSAADRQRARRLYQALVARAEVGDSTFWERALRGQMFLGDQAFAQRMQAQAGVDRQVTVEIPKAQRQLQRTWSQCLAACAGVRNQALAMGYRESGLTMTALAQHAGLSVSHVSRVIARLEAMGKEKDKT